MNHEIQEDEMAPHYTNDKAGVTLYLGDCLDVMAEIPDGSIDMVTRSKKYYNGDEA